MAVRTKVELAAQIAALLADNTEGDISAADVRSVLTDVLDSMAFLAGENERATNEAAALAAVRGIADAATTPGEATEIANKRAAEVAGPVIILNTITSYDSTQNRFEDSAGNAVAVPNGVIVTLAKSVYDAAVSDAGFTPNANAVFLTRP